MVLTVVLIAVILDLAFVHRKEAHIALTMHDVPYIDPSIADIGVSQLRKLNATDLRKGKRTLVIRENNVPLAVVLKYEQFLAMQDKLQAAQRLVDLFAKKGTAEELLKSLKDSEDGAGKDLADIAPELVRKQ